MISERKKNNKGACLMYLRKELLCFTQNIWDPRNGPRQGAWRQKMRKGGQEKPEKEGPGLKGPRGYGKKKVPGGGDAGGISGLGDTA